MSRRAAVLRGGSHNDVLHASHNFVVDVVGGRHDASAGIDCEQSARVVVQRVGDHVGCCVKVFAECRDTHCAANDDVFINVVGSAVSVYNGCDVEFIKIVHCDGVRLRGCAVVGGCCSHNDVQAGTNGFEVD